MASRERRRGRGPTIALALVMGAVVVVALARRQRLGSSTRDFHERHGPLDAGPAATTDAPR